MLKRPALSFAAALSLLAAGEAPASTKPCRDKAGKIIDCPKPARKVSPRCKDEKGRFAACRTATDAGAAGRPDRH